MCERTNLDQSDVMFGTKRFDQSCLYMNCCVVFIVNIARNETNHNFFWTAERGGKTKKIEISKPQHHHRTTNLLNWVSASSKPIFKRPSNMAKCKRSRIELIIDDDDVIVEFVVVLSSWWWWTMDNDDDEGQCPLLPTQLLW